MQNRFYGPTFILFHICVMHKSKLPLLRRTVRIAVHVKPICLNMRIEPYAILHRQKLIFLQSCLFFRKEQLLTHNYSDDTESGRTRVESMLVWLLRQKVFLVSINLEHYQSNTNQNMLYPTPKQERTERWLSYMDRQNFALNFGDLHFFVP